MGRKYYLARGYNTEKYWKCKLTKILDDNLKSLEQIDLFTSIFLNLESLKYYLLKKGLLNSVGEDVVISFNKTIDNQKN